VEAGVGSACFRQPKQLRPLGRAAVFVVARDEQQPFAAAGRHGGVALGRGVSAAVAEPLVERPGFGQPRDERLSRDAAVQVADARRRAEPEAGQDRPVGGVDRHTRGFHVRPIWIGRSALQRVGETEVGHHPAAAAEARVRTAIREEAVDRYGQGLTSGCIGTGGSTGDEDPSLQVDREIGRVERAVWRRFDFCPAGVAETSVQTSVREVLQQVRAEERDDAPTAGPGEVTPSGGGATDPGDDTAAVAEAFVELAGPGLGGGERKSQQRQK
jgi:hypothetical protein